MFVKISQRAYMFIYIMAWVFHIHFTLFRYVSILVELTRIDGTKHGSMIASQMLDVAIRVQAIRSFAVSQMVCYDFPEKKVTDYIIF